MKKLLLSILMLGVFGICFLYFNHQSSVEELSKYPQVHMFNQTLESLALVDSSTIVFSDCDDTLISSPDYLPATFRIPMSLMILLCLKHPWMLWHKELCGELYSLMLEKAQKILVDPEAVQFFTQLRKQGVHFLGITGMETGSHGLIQNMPAWRVGVLKNFGIPLNNEFENIVFDSLPTYRGNYPELHDGLICCNQISKGKVIGAFLDHFKLKPNIIVLFDDSHDELESLEIECQKRGIKALCFHFKGASKIKYTPWNVWQALKQFEYLMEKRVWLSDVEVRGMV